MTVASDVCTNGGAPLKIPPNLGVQKRPKSISKNHGHAALPKSYQIDELMSQTLQSHVSCTYLPSALETPNLKRAGGW